MRRARSLRLSSGRGRKISPTRSDITAITARAFLQRRLNRGTPTTRSRRALDDRGAALVLCHGGVRSAALAGTLSVIEILAVRSGLGLAVMAGLAAARADLRAPIVTRRSPCTFCATLFTSAASMSGR